MSDHSTPRRHVRLVVLPSGKTIEVVYVAADALPSPPAHVTAADAAAPHRCPACGSVLVYPLTWEEHGETHWEITLRCPECEWTGTGVYDEDAVERLDAALDRGTEALLRDLRRLMAANMEDEIRRLADALAEGWILPEDF